jgi:adenylate cyclase
MGVNWAAEGLLDGLEGEERESRIELLDALEAEGCELEDIKRADADGQLLFMLAGKALDFTVEYTFDELMERTDLDKELVVRLIRAQGFPVVTDQPGYGDTDVQMLEKTAEIIGAGVDVDDVVAIARLLGRGFEQAAQAMRGSAMRLVLEPGLGERELAVRYAHAASALTPMTEPLLGHLMRLHLSKSVQNEIVGAEERQTGRLPGSRPMVVGFADLVGFTRLGESIPVDELGAVAGRLEELVLDVLEPPVRFVKTIGDAAMLVSPEGEPLLENTLALVDAADAEGASFPQLRAGLAAGEAVSRAGDWFGRPVNLASRLTGIARPGSVLTTESLRDMAPDGFRWSKAGIRNIKGIPDPVPLWRVRRQEDEPDDDDA